MSHSKQSAAQLRAQRSALDSQRRATVAELEAADGKRRDLLNGGSVDQIVKHDAEVARRRIELEQVEARIADFDVAIQAADADESAEALEKQRVVHNATAAGLRSKYLKLDEQMAAAAALLVEIQECTRAGTDLRRVLREAGRGDAPIVYPLPGPVDAERDITTDLRLPAVQAKKYGNLHWPR